MGRLKKGYNAKARQQSAPNEKLKEECKKLKGNVQTNEDDRSFLYKANDSNALVMPVKGKLKEKVIKKTAKVKRKLSKKEKKKLQRIVDQKKKKEKREEILKSLSEHQVSSAELSLFKSTSKMGQTEVLKRKMESFDDMENISSTARRKRKRIKSKKEKFPKHDIVVTGELDQGSSSDSPDEKQESFKDREKRESGEGERDIDNEYEDQIQVTSDEVLIKTEENINDVENEISSGKEEDKKVIENLDTNNKSEAFGNPQNELLIVPTNDGNGTISHNDKKVNKRPVYVQVSRVKEVQAARLLLPILPEEQVVMEKVQENDITVICGSTGSGKTTQVPQFLYEAGYSSHSSHAGMIGVTEPRRVAAISMSKRVAHEMNLPTSRVSYQIRYEGNTTDETQIKFMTDGVLLKEMETDFLLTNYSALIIDEAHERSVFTDILIGLLSRVVPVRRKQNNPLKLIIMSATLRVEDFTLNTRLFARPPPVLHIDARQYPVTIHFNKHTREDYVTEAYKKVCKINRNLKPGGGILVFLTGQNEVLALCRKLRKTFPMRQKKQHRLIRIKKKSCSNKSASEESGLPKIDLDSYSSLKGDKGYIEDEADIEVDDGGEEDYSESTDDEQEENMGESTFGSVVDVSQPLHVLPLYSVLSSERQAKVFSPPPVDCRLCVVATNVAETSLTIPGIKYIVDSGKVKKKFYDKLTGVSTFRIVWTSKASANQRAGRAGRVEPGHCYRLYSSAVFHNDFEEFSEAEICRRPVDDLLLQMKSMCIDKVVNFPFPSPPDRTALEVAEKLLLNLGALKTHITKKDEAVAILTSLGKTLSKIPVSPRFAKMIMQASKEDGCLQYMIAIVAALTVKEIFSNDVDLSDVPENEKEDASKRRAIITAARRRWAGDGPSLLLGDLMVILRAVGACEFAGCSEKFCMDNGLRHKAMVEIRKLRMQLTNTVNSTTECKDSCVNPKMVPPTNEQALIIRQIVLSCFGDHVARKIPPEQTKTFKLKNAYMSCSSDDPVYIHPTSALFTKMPEYVVYHEIMETSKLYMKGLIAVEERWLSALAPHMCTFGKPLDEPPPCYDSKDDAVKCYRPATYGPHVWSLPALLLESPDSTDKFRWFARFLLEGQVISSLKEFATHLVTPALVMTASWSHLQKKSEELLRCLVNSNIDTKRKLMKKLKERPQYLLREYLQWFDESKHNAIRERWPPEG